MFFLLCPVTMVACVCVCEGERERKREVGYEACVFIGGSFCGA